MNKLDKLQDAAIDEVLKYFKSPSAAKEGGHIRESARIAVSALSSVGRIKATERARDATQLMVLRSITDDKKLFKEYVAVSMPHLNPGLQIEDKTQKKK